MKSHLPVLIFGITLCLISSAQPQDEENNTFEPLKLTTDHLDAATASHVSGLTVFGRFVAAKELERDTLFQALAPARGDNPKREEIYLLTLARTDNQPGRKRLMEIDAAVHLPNGRVVQFTLVPRSLLMRGQCWNLVQVVDHDELLPDEARTDILRLKPTIVIRSVRFK
jgi:hypothetical protein